MREFTMDDLRRIMRASVGEDDSINLDGDVLDTPFAELGYDSLALLEIASKVGKEFPVDLPEDSISDLETPRQFVEFVNKQLVVV